MKNILSTFLLSILVAGCTSTSSQQGISSKMVIGTYGSPPRENDTTILYDDLIRQLKDLNANTYNWLIMPGKKSFDQLKEFLPLAKKDSIDVWATLIPPTGLQGKAEQYHTNDMRKWGADLAALSLTNSNFKAWCIDDFTHNLKLYTPQYVSEFQDTVKKINPDFKFYPVCYYKSINRKFGDNYGSIIDGVLFPYRNESVKAGLIDHSHVAEEINTLRDYFEKKIPIFLDVYSSRHSQYGDPAREFISNVILSGLQNADGIIIYRHPSPKYDAEKYQTVKAAIAKGLEEKNK